MAEKDIKAIMMDEYIEYWMDKGVLEARKTEEHKKFTEEIDKEIQMIIDMSLPWQRKIITKIINEIRNMENARSSIEMESIIKLIYNNEDNKK